MTFPELSITCLQTLRACLKLPLLLNAIALLLLFAQVLSIQTFPLTKFAKSP